MRRAVPFVVLATAVVAACSDEPATGPAPTTTLVATAGAPVTSDLGTVPDPTTNAGGDHDDVVVPEGYARVQATVTEPDGTVCAVCLWLADTADRRRQGLMFVTDLGAADGMAFVYPTLHSGNFWMKNTLLPLSIAFFGPTGTYLDAFDMEPCIAEPCPLYATPDDFVVAVETTQGDLADLGIGPGSVLDLTDVPCDDATTRAASD